MTPALPKIPDSERRARLARRHALAPGHRAGDVVDAARRVVCLHATDPATVYLSAWARMEAMETADLDRALYGDRSLVKHMAMRRTLFVFPRETLPVAQAGASVRVAGFERRRLIKDVEQTGLHRDGARWLGRASKQVLAALDGGREASFSELRDELPAMQGRIEYAPHKSWGGMQPVGPRVLTVLSGEGRIVRATNDGRWTLSRPRWATMESWLGEDLAAPEEAEGVKGLVERWLRAFGPGTEGDVKWWLGSTLTAVRRALAELEAVPVELDGGATGYLMPDDLDPTEPVEPWAALLPPLDPTTMGWQERDWYLGPHRAQLFDTAGNAGPTLWWDGRIVGAWLQRENGEVVLLPLDDVGSDGTAALEREAARLTDWFAGVRVLPRFPSPLAKTAAL
jgi:hypothetical protein